jgi:hypothetical protein
MDLGRDIHVKVNNRCLPGRCRLAGKLRWIDANIINVSVAFDLIPHNRMLIKIATSGVDFSVVVWIREFLLGRTQGVRVGGQSSEDVRVISGVPQGSLLSPLQFLAYINYIWGNAE